jgi:hypothetical protein
MPERKPEKIKLQRVSSAMGAKPPASKMTVSKTFGSGKLSLGVQAPPVTRSMRLNSAKGSRPESALSNVNEPHKPVISGMQR